MVFHHLTTRPYNSLRAQAFVVFNNAEDAKAATTRDRQTFSNEKFGDRCARGLWCALAPGCYQGGSVAEGKSSCHAPRRGQRVATPEPVCYLSDAAALAPHTHSCRYVRVYPALMTDEMEIQQAVQQNGTSLHHSGPRQRVGAYACGTPYTCSRPRLPVPPWPQDVVGRVTCASGWGSIRGVTSCEEAETQHLST